MKRPGYVVGLAGLFLSFVTAPCLAKDHVVILTIGSYPSSPLQGVRFDADNGLRLAAKLGFDVSAPRVFRDQQLSEQGFLQVLEQLQNQVAANDRVFFYYSGHGISYQQQERCEQGLVSADERVISFDVLNRQVSNLLRRAPADFYMVIDACHSGGLGDVAVVGSGAARGGKSSARFAEAGQLKPKVFIPKDGQHCENATNVLAALGVDAQSAPTLGLARAGLMPRNNFVFLSAAAASQAALDDPERGGVATQALSTCLDQGVRDSNGSGAVTADELAECANQVIRQAVPEINAKRNSRWAPHTVEARGNISRPLPVKVLASAPTGASTPVPTLMDRNAQAVAAFKEVEASSNGNWGFSVAVDARVPLNGKSFFEYETRQGGYLTVWYVGTEHGEIKALLENVLIPAGKRRVPEAITITAPLGENTFLAILSDRPLDGDAMRQKFVKTDGSQGSGAAAIACTFSRNASMSLAMKTLLENNCGSERARNAAMTLPPANDNTISGQAARVFTITGY